jgi:hypothetical protein
LFLVSVLLDAGAGNAWAYTENGGEKFGRSEGLAIASLDMFLAGFFSSDGGLKVNGMCHEPLYYEICLLIIHI